MNTPPVDLSYLHEQFAELAARVREASEASGDPAADPDAVGLLRDAMSQLIDMLSRIQSEARQGVIDPTELNTLGAYGLHLVVELSQMAARLNQAALVAETERLSLPLALWIARHGGELRDLSATVNALAHFANQASDPQAMAALYSQCCELIEAASPGCEERGSRDPQDPWRLLLLNRAIVATRSHNPELMEPAFDAIVECLPGDAHHFFTEGMAQMQAINYPDHVCDIVRRYYLAHAAPRRLH